MKPKLRGQAGAALHHLLRGPPRKPRGPGLQPLLGFLISLFQWKLPLQRRLHSLHTRRGGHLQGSSLARTRKTGSPGRKPARHQTGHTNLVSTSRLMTGTLSKVQCLKQPEVTQLIPVQQKQELILFIFTQSFRRGVSLQPAMCHVCFFPFLVSFLPS